MSDADVVTIRERKGHHSILLLRLRSFPWREQVLQDRNHTLSQRRREALKDQVRITLADRPPRAIRNIVSQNNIVQGEHRRRAVREVRNGERRRGTTVLVNDDKVGGGGGVCGLAERRQNGITTVQADRVRQKQADLFGELHETGRGVAGGGDDDLGVDETGESGILVVYEVVVAFAFGFVVLEVFAQLLIVGNIFGERLWSVSAVSWSARWGLLFAPFHWQERP